MGQDRIELAGETVEFTVGQGEPGQARQVGDLVSGNLGHGAQA